MENSEHTAGGDASRVTQDGSQKSHENTQDRAEERGSAAEPDAPTSGEENEGLSTVLSADPLAGVQANESEE